MIDLAVVVLYFMAMLFVGWRSRRQSPDSYWIAERRYSTSRITISLVASVFGASSTMGIIGLGYLNGLTGAWWSMIGGLSLVPFGFFLASRVRRLNVYTLPDILNEAYGKKVAVLAALMISIAWCGVVAAQLIAGARLIEGLFTIDFQSALFGVAVVFTLYTFWGGQLSVIKTDFWQFSLFVGGLLVSLLFLIFSQGDAVLALENVPRGHLQFPVSEAFGWYELLVFYPLIVGLPYLVGPDIYSRILCARDNRVARRAPLFAATIIIPLSLVLAVFGMLARARFPGILAEAALPETLSTLLPQGIKGLVVAGFLGAIMSSADTCLLSASTILTLNILRPVFSLEKDKYLMITRGAVIFLGAVAWFIAGRQQGIISSLLLAYTVFVGGVVCPTLAGFFRKELKISSTGALWAVIGGGVAAIVGKIQGGALLKTILTPVGQGFLEQCLGPHYPSLFPIVLSILILFTVSRVFRE